MLAKSIMMIPITEVSDFSSSPICGSSEVFACFSAEKQAKTSELPQMGDEEKSEASVIGIIMMLFASILAMLGLSDKKKKA